MDYLKSQMKKMYATSMVTSIIMFILGVFLLVRPDFIINIVSTIIGLVILVPGIISLIDYFKTKYTANLVIGVIAFVLGIVFIFNSKLVSSILPFVLGIYFIINGISKIQYAFELRKNNVVNYYTAFALNDLFLKYRSSFYEDRVGVLDGVLESDVLIIDDLGSEPNMKNTEEYFYLLFNERLSKNKSTIITTNLALEQLLARYGERTFSRLCNKANSLMIKIQNKDLRLKR